MTTQGINWRRLFSAASTADFEALYREQMPRIYNFFRYRLGDEALAEDLTASTFEKAWQKRGLYRHDLAAFTTWLFTIARHTAIDYYRQKKSEVALDEIEHFHASENLDERIQKEADLATLQFLLAQLSDRDRELVALKYGAGLTNRMIAQLSGLSETNVAVILHRIILKLRQDWSVSDE